MASSNNPQHESLAAGRWFTMTLAEQLGNIESEFQRALSAKEKGGDRFKNAVNRFYELMDLTVSDNRWRGPRRKELARVREDAARELVEVNIRPTLQSYFDQFALMARAKR